jgi:hypothetical protein
MGVSPPPRIVNCDRLGNSIVVSFEDSKSGIYSADLLYATLPQARAMPADPDVGGMLNLTPRPVSEAALEH